MQDNSVKITSFSFMRRSRIAAFQALFQFEFYNAEKSIDDILPDLYEVYLNDFAASDIEKIININLMENLVKTAINQKQQIFNIIAPFLNQNWKVEDLSLNLNIILCLATAEILTSDTDLPIIINEYIEITKIYETPKEAKFINKILQQIGDSLRKTA